MKAFVVVLERWSYDEVDCINERSVDILVTALSIEAAENYVRNYDLPKGELYTDEHDHLVKEDGGENRAYIVETEVI